MIPINIRRNSNGVPILKQTEIDLIAEALVYDFCPEVLSDPKPVDVDAFCESYMKLHLDYQYLSNNGVYLGMTVFDDTDKVVVYDPVLRRAEYTSVKAGTVIIDNTLLETNQEHRYRFTMGHEAAGHAVLHKPYFDQIKNRKEAPMIQCRMDSNKKKDPRAYTDIDWMEWQADKMSSSFLMPKTSVQKVAERIKEEMKGNWGYYVSFCLVQEVSKVFNVSQVAAILRLKTLELIPKEFHL